MDQVGALRKTESGMIFLTEENPLWFKPFCALNLAAVLVLEQVSVIDDLREQSGHVWMWELDCEESWALKNWSFWTVVLEKTLESPLNCKEIQPVHSKGDQPWVFFGRNDPKAEIPILWPPHEKSWLIGKDSDDGRDWGQKEKGTTEDEMAGWHHGLDGREFEWTPGVGDGQEGLVCYTQGVSKSWTRLSDWSELNSRLTMFDSFR